jgi:hypothetical protein
MISARRATVAFLVVFVVSRLGVAWSGLGFSTEHVASIMHFPDLELLRDRWLETVWFLHGQPPGPSLVLGGLQQIAGASWPTALALLSHGLVGGLGLAMLTVCCRLGVRPGAALAAALGFLALPSVLVYEHYAFTTLPLAALLLFACVPLCRVATGGPSALQAFLLLAASVLWVRNVFHLVWWLACLLLAWRVSPARRRTVLLAALLPALVAVAPYAKNAFVHGRFEASSWLGFGLARKTYHQEPLAVRQAEALRGERPAIEGVPVFGSVEEYALAVPLPAATGVPLLDAPRKRNGEVNYHHAIVATASAQMARSALAHLARQPERYLQNVATTAAQFFAPAAAWPPVATPRASLGRYGRFLDGLLHTPWFGPCNLWFLFTLAALGSTLPAVWRVVGQRRRADAADVVATFCSGTFVYLALVAVCLDTGEVMRHRLKVDGLLWLAAALRWLPKHAASPIPSLPLASTP